MPPEQGKSERIEIEIHSATRRESCLQLARDFVRRHDVTMARAAVMSQKKHVNQPSSFVYIDGLLEGFSLCAELIVSGAMIITEIKPDHGGNQEDLG